jgi:hypothetical protein
MSLVALPFRTVLTWNSTWPGTLGKFLYVDSEWPDVESLNDDGSFDQFLVIGILLNALLLLGLIVFFSEWSPASALPIAVLLWSTTPYFISQTIFTWPKALAGFFLVLAWDSLRRNRAAAVVALLAALA